MINLKNIFRQTVDPAIPQVQVLERPKKKPSTREIIEEIHETFNTEVDRLLAEAGISKSLETQKEELIAKCAKLKSLGFTNTKEVKEAEEEISRLRAIEMENEANRKLVEAINYFSFKYPQYKFITEESVKKICAKYGLIYGEVDKYIGTVPDKNVKQMQEFDIQFCDRCHLLSEMYDGWPQMELSRRYVGGKEVLERMEEGNKQSGRFKTRCFRLPLEIAAPASDFNTKDMEVKNFKLSKVEIPYPIVLCPVIYNEQKHYLIVTMWGLEASDELVVNEKMN